MKSVTNGCGVDDLGRTWKKVMLKSLGRRKESQQQAEAQMFALLFYREMHRNMGGKAWKGIPTSPKPTTGVTNNVVTDSDSEGLPTQHMCQSPHASDLSLPVPLTLTGI